MQPEEARIMIKKILESEVSFDGHFDKCLENLKETQQQEILVWLEACKLHKIDPVLSKKDRNLIGFVKRIGSNLRAILTKEKKGYFMALFLDKHKYYELEMARLGF